MLSIYNSFTQKKEIFQPLEQGKISLYVCGITVYDYCHIGHARVFVAFDTIVRFLRSTGWQVNYVRNITDVDDKIIKRAKEQKESISELTGRFIDAMHTDMQSLQVLMPDHSPQATQHIPQMVALILRLYEKGFAYVTPKGDVYFSTEKFERYGQLGKKTLLELQEGARVEVEPEKRSPCDFVLWKKSQTEQELSWPSPWGKGRPGWHIECSAMSMAYLGEQFDIHGGGADLLFPHHENERAQSECASNKPFANYWMHAGFIQIDKQKMSKSLNNFFTIRDVLRDHDPEVVRYFLIASHYRSPIHFSEDKLLQAKQALERLYHALKSYSDNTLLEEIENPFYERFVQAMQDDFNTPVALSILFDLAHQIHLTPTVRLMHTLKVLGNMLGLLGRSAQAYFQVAPFESLADIEALVKARQEARRLKQWEKADAIRNQLTELGIIVEDQEQGASWRRV